MRKPKMKEAMKERKTNERIRESSASTQTACLVTDCRARGHDFREKRNISLSPFSFIFSIEMMTAAKWPGLALGCAHDERGATEKQTHFSTVSKLVLNDLPQFVNT